MFLLVRQCAEPMIRLRRLYVKVTLQGHVIYPSNRVHSISPEPLNDFHKNVPLKTHDPVMQTQGQDHTSTTLDLPLNFVFAPHLLKPFKEFH